MIWFEMVFGLLYNLYEAHISPTGSQKKKSEKLSRITLRPGRSLYRSGLVRKRYLNRLVIGWRDGGWGGGAIKFHLMHKGYRKKGRHRLIGGKGLNFKERLGTHL